MNFVILDICLLISFVLFVSIFLYIKRKNLGKEGPLFLYRTSWGIKLINYVGNKYKRTLKSLSYISIIIGYFLMTGIFFLIIQTVYLYLTTPIVKIIRVPPIAPLIPYFPKLFGLESFFPPFYFIYFIIAILIVATVHEFSHGIFARRFGIKIKSTGFAFFKYFPAFLGAFVEQDEKQMIKAKKFEQMSVLSAGVFANILTTILFYIILFIFFSFAFTASGIIFNTYSYSAVGISNITSVNNISLDNPSYESILNLTKEDGLNKIKTSEESYVVIKKVLLEQKENQGILILYNDAPAINVGIENTITEINGVRIDSIEKLQKELNKYSPGDKVDIKTISSEGVSSQEIILGEHPQKEGAPWLGIGFYDNSQRNVLGKALNLFPSYKKQNVYYESNDINLFIKNLLWWIIIINLLVALFNMLPLGILDGGRFFYLTVLAITKSEKIAKKSFLLITYFILFLFIILMIKWVFSFW